MNFVNTISLLYTSPTLIPVRTHDLHHVFTRMCMLLRSYEHAREGSYTVRLYDVHCKPYIRESTY